MRKLLALVILLVSTSFLAAEEQTALATMSTQQGPWASVDGLIWTPRMRGLDFAISEDGSAFTVGTGDVHEVDLQSDTGLRAMLGYAWQSGWDVGVAYTHFETDGSTTINRPPGTGQLFPTFSHPGGPAEADVAIGTAHLDYNVIDLLAGRNAWNSSCFTLDLFGGFRWMDIGQGVGVRLDGRDFTNGEILSTKEIEGFGLRFGGQGRVLLARGFSVFGNASAAAIRANFDNRRVETDFGGARLLVDLEDAYTQATLNFETSTGFAWNYQSWSVGAGYELNVWTNITESLRFVDDIEQGGLSSVTGDLLLEGFFFRIAKMW